MTIDYQEEEILRREDNVWRKKPFIGYISPKGDIINFSTLIGEPGHGNWRNPITPYFLKYISFLVIGENYEKYKNDKNEVFRQMYENNKYEGFDDIVRRGLNYFEFCNYDDYNSFLERLNETIKKQEKSRQDWAKLCSETSFSYRNDDSCWTDLEYDLMHFFEKCYSSRDFFHSFGRVIKVHNQTTVLEKYQGHYEDTYRGKEDFYYNYCVVNLMSYFKDIMIQYLGYDSIERAWPNYDLNILNNLYRASNGYTFAPNPKTILTSCPNPNERFYNWAINDWVIKRVPRMYWNEQEKRFIQENPSMICYQTEKEEILANEIESIRRQVPKQYRKKYFRK